MNCLFRQILENCPFNLPIFKFEWQVQGRADSIISRDSLFKIAVIIV